MKEDQPGILAYRAPALNKKRAILSGRFVAQLFIGLALGTGISALVWILGWNRMPTGGVESAVVFMPMVKAAAGGVLMVSDQYRGMGVGILLSIALGFLIFFGTCAAHVQC